MRLTEEYDHIEGSGYIDALESYFENHEWPYQREDENVIRLEASGGWCDYDLVFFWHHNTDTLHFACRPNYRIPKTRQTGINDLIGKVNGHTMVGHFALCPEDGTPTFRHSFLLRGVSNIASEQLEDMIELGMGECERFYPAFQGFLWGRYSAEDAIKNCMINCEGEA